VDIKCEATSLSFPIGKAECKAQSGSRLDARLLLQGFLVSMELYWDRRMIWSLAGITWNCISIRIGVSVFRWYRLYYIYTLSFDQKFRQCIVPTQDLALSWPDWFLASHATAYYVSPLTSTCDTTDAQVPYSSEIQIMSQLLPPRIPTSWSIFFFSPRSIPSLLPSACPFDITRVQVPTSMYLGILYDSSLSQNPRDSLKSEGKCHLVLCPRFVFPASW
jgi:hypothetical protein